MIRKIALSLAAATLTFQVSAADDLLMIDVKTAMQTPAAQQQLTQGVDFYFGESKHPKVVKNLGTANTSQRTNGFNKTADEACNWVFVSAMKQLQKEAIHQGGDAVINIKSNFKHNLVSDNDRFQCADGTFLTGVALTGDLVKLK